MCLFTANKTTNRIFLQAGFIKHTVNKSSFSEQCYYTFGDIATALANCNLKVGFSISSKFRSRNLEAQLAFRAEELLRVQ